MKGLTTSNGGSNRSQSTCSFCRSPDHQVGKCPHVAIIKKSLDKGVIPLKYMASVSPNKALSGNTYRNNSYWRSPLSGYYSHGDNWGELHKQTQKAYDKWSRAQDRAKNKGKKRSTANRTCGYCGSKDHTRRTCGLLASHKTKLAKANRNFRKWFYQEYVEGQGLSTGAIAEITCHDEGGHYREASTETIRTLVTEINWDSINLFACKEDAEINWRSVGNWTGADLGCTQDKLTNIQNFIQSGAYLKVPKSAFEGTNIQYGSQSWNTNEQPYRAVPLPTLRNASERIKTWDTKTRYYTSSKIQSVKIVSRAPQVLADDWVDGYSDEMSVIFKKFTLAQLEFLGVIEHIKEWAKKDQ